MHEDLFVRLVWGLPLSSLPPGFDPDATNLGIYQAGLAEGDPANEFVGLEVTEELSGLNEITHATESFEDYEATRRKVEAAFSQAGVRTQVELYLLQGLGG